MKKWCLAFFLACLMLWVTGCTPVDLSTLGNHIGGADEEAPVVYEDDNAGQPLDVVGPEPDEWN